MKEWLRRLQDFINDCRADEPLIERLAAVLGFCAIVFLGITLLRMQSGYVFAAPQHSLLLLSPAAVSIQHQGAAEAAILVESEYAAMRSQMYESVRMAYGRMKAACMAGDLRITWVDPYTKVDMSAACDVVALGRIPK